MRVPVPLLALALAPISTLPTTPATHWTVMVPLPVETMLAMVSPVGFSTINSPAYGATKLTGPVKGDRLNVPVAANVTSPLEYCCASAVTGVTEILSRMRSMLGLLVAQEMRSAAPAVTATIARNLPPCVNALKTNALARMLP